MKKLATIFMVMMLLVSFVWAENSNQAIKRVQWSREMSKLSQPEQLQVKAQVQNREQIKNDREEAMRNQMGKTHRSTAAHKVQSKLQVLKDVGGFQPVQTSQSKFVPKSANFVEFLDTLALLPFVPDTIEYIAGASFVFQLFSSDTVILEFWVDNGDSVFGYDDFLIKLDMDGEDAIKVWDGAEFDESLPGDGLFQVTINTGNIANDGPEPFFGLQNCIIYVNAWNVYQTEMFNGVAYVGAPDEETSIEGTVSIEAAPVKSVDNPAANIVVWAAKMSADTMYNDWEPEVAFLTMTDEFGHYRIEIPDMYRGNYVVGIADVWGLYPGYFSDPSEIDIYIGGDIAPVDFMLILGKETIYGIVEDENATGIGGIHIGAWGPYGDVEVMTGPDGSFSIPAMPGWWEVSIEDDDIMGQYMLTWSQGLEVFENGDHPVNFTLYSLDASFTGNVRTSDGSPLMDVEINTDIWLGMQGGYNNRTRTDEFGNYELWVSTALQGITMQDSSGWVDTSSYWIGAWMEDAMFMPDSYYRQYAPASGLDFTAIIADASLSGTVYDANSNNPLRDAQIHAFQPMAPDKGSPIGGLDFWAYTDESGHYELPLVGGAYPGSTWMIEVYWPWEWMPSIVDSMNVLSGNNYTQDYYINPPVREGFINGYVFDKDGGRISNARVEIYGPNYYEVYTDGNGYFSVSQVPFGWYSFTAYADSYDPYSIYDIWVDQYPVYLEFWMGSIVGDITINGHIRDSQTALPLGGSILMAFNWNYYEPFTLFMDTTGYYELKVKSGYYDFQAGANGYWAQKLYGIDVVSDTTIDFYLQSAASSITDTLKGNVIDDIGNPLRKVFIYMESESYIGYTYSDFNGQYAIGLPTGYYEAMYAKNDFNNEWRYFNFPSEGPGDPVILYSNNYVFGPIIKEILDVPMDHGKQVRLTWKRAEGLYGAVKEYQIWRAIKPMYGPEPQPEFETGWDYVTTVPINPQMDHYNVVVPTLYDKVGDNIHWTGYVISAIGWDSWSYWNSNILAGWSEDNLPPEVPVGLTAVGGGDNIVLQWAPVTSEKVKYYSVYRKTALTDFEVIGYSPNVEYIDATALSSVSYTYTVTATDFGLNESAKSEPVSMSALAIDSQEEIPTKFALKPNYPNPFNPETTIEFALPKTSKVTLTIYNLMGQMVQELVQNEYPAGYQRVIWNGQDSRGNVVGSGVYIYTLKAGNFSQTRKMILMR
ncbi:carboxypeptidase regulatory-like domain-containing protein [bacterium]|nr:carboxypeptidase regulatory-like domain-containing protein [bacterium]MBU1064377.1 carboxypeptidase regulatory-like domain-containing protein [bacterium]MBU1634448.1 carboxypeptidase regulatory-like domain-containing protein [bacterium]MBU1874606.1 carboxypeptidase regulatory-like domain-containing protein [bacterium]